MLLADELEPELLELVELELGECVVSELGTRLGLTAAAFELLDGAAAGIVAVTAKLVAVEDPAADPDPDPDSEPIPPKQPKATPKQL